MPSRTLMISRVTAYRKAPVSEVKTMRNSSSGTQLMTQLEKLINKGDHVTFFRVADTMKPSIQSWSTVKLRSIEVLIEQGDIKAALDTAWKLKNSLCLPEQRHQAALIWHYLKYLSHGRRKSDEALLKKVIDHALKNPKASSIYLCAIHMQLRVSADKLMAGNIDANFKSGLIEDFKEYLNTCLKSDLLHNAFIALREVSQLMLSKPFPMENECLHYLKSHIDQTFIQKSAYRTAFVFLTMAEITFEQHLKGQKRHVFKEYYQSALNAFRKAKHKQGEGLVYESYGRLLLQYGKAKGKSYLDKAIRNFESKGADIQCLRAYHSIIFWLEKQGNMTAAYAYRMRANELNNAPSGIAPSQKTPHESSLVDLANQLIYETGHCQIIRQKLPQIRQYGETLHLARVLERKFELNESFSSLNQGKEAIDLYIRLGYRLEAARIIQNWLIRFTRNQKAKTLNIKTSSVVRMALLQQRDILQHESCLESQEMLVLSYQLAASVFTSSSTTELTKQLKKAEDILSDLSLMPQKALHQFYKACLTLESADQTQHFNSYSHAADYFEIAYRLFRDLNHHEGMWRSQFGKAVCLSKKLELTSEPSMLMVQSGIEAFNRALEIVVGLTKSYICTASSFGEPLQVNAKIQGEAFQLFSIAHHFFDKTLSSPTVSFKLKKQLHDWCQVNQNQQEIQPN